MFVFRTAADTNFTRLDIVQETEESPRKKSDSAARPDELSYFVIGSKRRDTAAADPLSLNTRAP